MHKNICKPILMHGVTVWRQRNDAIYPDKNTTRLLDEGPGSKDMGIPMISTSMPKVKTIPIDGQANLYVSVIKSSKVGKTMRRILRNEISTL